MIVVADNLNVVNPVVAAALKNLEAAPLQELARRCEQAGAKILDINPGYLSPRHEDRMVFMVEAVQQVTQLRLMLDSPNPRVLAQGLAACNQPPVLNALTLEPEKLRGILPLAAAREADLVLLLLDERSFPPPSLEGKVAVAMSLRDAALNAGVKEERLIFDAVLPNLSWPDAWAQVGAIVKLVRLLADGALLQSQARTLVGLSNLRSGLRQTYPAKIDESCLYLMAGAGLTYVLADVLQPNLMDTVRFINQLL
ncbi:MAG: dihydropteroate synthase [Deltaproteobacteria bacterium]|nr:dihydropteroate synthase [Deltaproteobacteria bacterium]